MRQALRSKITQWQSDQLAADSTPPHARQSTSNVDSSVIYRSAQQHEDMSFRHLDLAFDHWNSLPHETRRDAWQLEIARAFACEVEKRKSLDEQLARVQQEANQLRAQVERLGSCQWPREFALFPPDTLPLPRDVARELETQESPISAESSRWDYDNVVAKWKRVVMHDKGMGRVGVGYGNTITTPAYESDHSNQHQPAPPRSPDLRPPRPGEDAWSHPNRLRPFQPSASAASPDPANVSTPASSTHYASPFSHTDPRSPPAGSAGGCAPQAKRPRLMNGSESALGLQAGGSGHESSAPAPSLAPIKSTPGPWSASTPLLSNVAAPSGHKPPTSSSRG